MILIFPGRVQVITGASFSENSLGVSDSSFRNAIIKMRLINCS